MGNSQKRAIQNYRSRLSKRGLARFEVLGLDVWIKPVFSGLVLVAAVALTHALRSDRSRSAGPAMRAFGSEMIEVSGSRTSAPTEMTRKPRSRARSTSG